MCFFYSTGRKSCTFCTFWSFVVAQHVYSFLLGNICRKCTFFSARTKGMQAMCIKSDKNTRKILKMETKRKANCKNYEHSWWLLQQYLLATKNNMKSFKKLVKHFSSFIWYVREIFLIYLLSLCRDVKRAILVYFMTQLYFFLNLNKTILNRFLLH